MFNAKIIESIGDRNSSPLKPAALITLVVVCVMMATAEVFFGVDEPPPAPSLAGLPSEPSLALAAIEAPNTAATCAGTTDASGEECGNGLEPTATLTPATKQNVGKRIGLAVAGAGRASVRPTKVAKSAIEQVNPENQTVGCAGGEAATCNDCM